MTDAKNLIVSGKAVLGIELGSTRIKSVLIDEGNKPLAQGSFEWENQLENGLWTYSIDMIWKGLQGSYSDLRANVRTKYGVEIESLAAIGVSAMMHGYMPFDKEQNILVPFRTWRNTNTGKAADLRAMLPAGCHEASTGIRKAQPKRQTYQPFPMNSPWSGNPPEAFRKHRLCQEHACL